MLRQKVYNDFGVKYAFCRHRVFGKMANCKEHDSCISSPDLEADMI